MKYIVKENGQLVKRQCPNMPMREIHKNAAQVQADAITKDNAERAAKNQTAAQHYLDLVDSGDAIEWVEHEHPLSCYDPALPNGELVELTDAVYELELEACQLLRKKEYRKTGDVLDMFAKSILADAAPFSPELMNWANECKAVKDKHPKPARKGGSK